MTGTFVVIGGDAAGMSAASKARRSDPDLDVVVFERGQWVSYAACGIPYYVGGEVETLDDLVAVTPEEFVEERRIDLRTAHEVTAIDPDARTVTVEGDGDRFEQSYDHLLVATGASAVAPPFDGTDLDGVFTIRGLDDAAAVRDDVEGWSGSGSGAGAGGRRESSEATTPRAVGVVGGGYVGIEMAEAFAARDAEVHLFEALPHVLDPFGEATAGVVEDHLRERGVSLHLDTPVEGFVGDGRVTGVETESGTVAVDAVVVGVGVAPNVDLVEGTRIERGPTGAIATDEYGRTNVDDVFAAGDCAEARHVVSGAPAYVPLALTANRAGRAIGSTVTGTPTEVGDIAGTAILKAFDLEVARTGILDHEEAREAGFDPVTSTITDRSRADYYPGAEEITVTLTADRDTGRVLGGSVVGRDRAGKRIDPVATALHAGMTVTDLQNLDLAYAPPFSPVWDPVLTAARVLRGELDA
ncbi:MAG: FAD-dependent oxidoreductase [Haloferacaceae archaeon]